VSGFDAAALRGAVRAELPAAGALRRELHARPHPSGQEGPTLETVLGALPDGAVTRVADTGALVRFGGDGPAVGMRAELDALPIAERTGAAWASRGPAMHACGHDVHMAALVAVCRALSEIGPPVPVLAVLQPREETYPSGARDIVASGLLDGALRAMVGAHVQPALPPGTIACTPGAVNAAADEFTVTMRGPGGHAAYPHLTSDPVLALAQFVVGAQQIAGRDADPMVPAVVTVGTLRAGEAPNAIPGTAAARGTLRAMSGPQRDLLRRRLREVATGVAAIHGCTADVEVTEGEPVLVNDADLAAGAARALSAYGRRVDAASRSCGADDFAYYTAAAPALMMFAGTGGDAALHSPAFLPGDDALAAVADALLAGYLAAAGRA
jgi:amidohydrolase